MARIFGTPQTFTMQSAQAGADFSDNFNQGFSPGWSFIGNRWSIDNGEAKVEYDGNTAISGDQVLYYDFPSHVDEVFIAFNFRHSGANVMPKWVKFHGEELPGDNYSNVTFGSFSYHASLDVAYFGQNIAGPNDVNGAFLNLNGNPPVLPRASSPNIIVPGGNPAPWIAHTELRRYQIHWKLNRNNTNGGVLANGECQIIVDGVTRLHVTGFYNRGDAHLGFNRVGLGDYTNWSGGYTPFDMWYSNLVISSTQMPD